MTEIEMEKPQRISEDENKVAKKMGKSDKCMEDN